jgi:hypothetical protein
VEHHLHLEGQRISKQERKMKQVASRDAYIPEDRTLHNHICENFRSYVKQQKHISPEKFLFSFQFHSDN